MSPQPLKLYAFVSNFKGPNKTSLVQAFRSAASVQVEASAALPIPRPHCWSYSSVQKCSAIITLAYICTTPESIFLKTYSNSVFLSPFVPMASSSGGEQLRGLALNPCLQLPPSLLAFSY